MRQLGPVLLLTLLVGCTRNAPPPAVSTAPPTAIPPVTFTDITRAAGLRFTHVNGAFGKKLLPETMGSGCAFLDYDGDGRQDIFLVNSCYWPGFAGKGRPTLALYRNRGDGTFDDVTRAAGLDVSLYGMGVAVGDYDNDGRPDLFVTAVGGSRLFHNADGKRFVEATAGDLKETSWPTAAGDAFLAWDRPISFPSSAAFLDYDKDGWLDLFVCQYLEWSPKSDLAAGFSLAGKAPAYGPPRAFPGAQCRLYRNRGDGTFADVSNAAGIEVFNASGKPAGKALGVIACDLDDDGWPDLVVANDTERNFLFHNQAGRGFVEKGLPAGVAYAPEGARGAMGIDWGEIRPGQPALLIGNFADEPDSLLRLEDRKRLRFADVAKDEGIAGPSTPPLVFGAVYLDYDLDGRLDVLTNNGHLEPGIALVRPQQTYRQPPQLFWNTGGRPGFALAGPRDVGPDLLAPLVGRGCAYADVDGNGTLDVLLTENGGPARLLKNGGRPGNHWVRLVLEGDGKRCNRSAIGARVSLTAGGSTQVREVRASKGYLSCSELPLTFGLGSAGKVDRVEVRWPGKDVPPTVLTDLAVDRVHTIRCK